MIIHLLHPMRKFQLPALENPLASLLIHRTTFQSGPSTLPSLLNIFEYSTRKGAVGVWWRFSESLVGSLHAQLFLYLPRRIGIYGICIRGFFQIRPDKGVITAANNDYLCWFALGWYCVE